MKPQDNKQATNATRNPNQLELATLAATLAGSGRQSRIPPSKAVRMALEIWREAGAQLSDPVEFSEKAATRKRIVGELGQALLVSKHFMPELLPEHYEHDRCDFDQFLRFAVGLSEKCDRLKWFRGFVQYWGEPMPGSKIGTPFYEFGAQSPFSLVRKVPIDPGSPSVRGPIPRPGKALEEMRERGVNEPAIMAAAFRAWRLTRNGNPDQKASEPLTVEMAAANAAAKK